VRSFLIFTGTGPILALSTYAELDDPSLVEKLRYKGISKFIAYEVALDAVRSRYGQAFASIALKRVENPVDFGIVITKPDGEIERFLEKPTWGQVFSDTINTGIYVLEPEVFDFISEGEVVDFASDVFPAALDRELRPRRLGAPPARA